MSAVGQHGRRGRGVALLVLTLGTLVACGDLEPSGPTVTPEPTPSPSLNGSPSPAASPPLGPGAVEAAKADLVGRFAYDPAAIEIDRIEAVEWPNAALGCPLADRTYDPGPFPGYRIVLRVGELTFHYHGGAGAPEPMLCQFLD